MSKRFIFPLTIYLVFFQNPAVYGGVIVDDDEVTNVETFSGMTFATGTDDTTNLGGVVIIENSADSLFINIGARQINAGYVDAADANTNHANPAVGKITAFYANPLTHTFDDTDHIAILNLTNNDTRFTTSRSGIDGILGNVVLFGGNNTIVGTGLGDLIGSIDTGDGDDTVDFSGTAWVHSDTNLRNGNNVVRLTENAFMDGDLTLGTGDDEVYLAGRPSGVFDAAYVNVINIAGGNNTITVEQESNIRGAVTTGAGADVLTLSEQGFISATGNVSLGDGNDIVIVSGVDIPDDPATPLPTNEFVRAAFIGGSLDLGDGDDRLTVSQESAIDGSVDGGAGNDIIRIEDTATVGTIITAATIDLEEGDDTFVAEAGTTILGNILLGDDNDNAFIDFKNQTLTSGTFDTGNGNDVFILKDLTINAGTTSILGGATNTGTSNITVVGNGETFNNVAGNYFVFDNVDLNDTDAIDLDGANNTIRLRNGYVFTLDLTEVGGAFATDANNTIYLEDTSQVDGSVTFGDGDNTIRLEGTATITGDLTTGTGENTFIYSGSGDKVQGDTVTDLGAGNILVLNNLTTLQDEFAAVDTNFNLAHFKSISITGGVAFETGAPTDTITLISGAFDNTVTLNNASITDSIVLAGDNAGTVTLSNDSSIIGNITFNGTTTDNLTLTGGSTITGDVDMGDAINNLTMTGSTINGTNFTGGTGVDTLSLNGSTMTIANSVALEDDDNVITLSNSSRINATALTALGGDDILTVQSNSRIDANIDLGDGANDIILNNATINGTIDTGTGADELTANSTTITGDVDTGDGVDTVDLADTIINGELDLGAGTDSLTLNNSTVTNNIEAGGDDDQLTLNGNGTINSQINGFGDINKNGSGTWTLNSNTTVDDLVNINAGTFNLNSTLGATTTTVSNGATLNWSGGTITGDVVINGDLNGGGVITGDLNVSGTITPQNVADDVESNTLTLNDGAYLNVIFNDLTADASIANFKVTGAVTNAASAEGTTINITNNLLFENNDEILLIEAGGGIDPTKFKTTLDSFVLSATLDLDGTDLRATFARTAYPDLDSAVIREILPTMTQLETVRNLPGTAANAQYLQELIKLENLNKSGFEKAAKQINPSAIANLTNIGLSSHRDFTNHVNKRLNFMQFGFQTFSLEGPEGPENEVEDMRNEELNVWVESNFRTGEQDSDGATLGYDFTNYNLTIGGDAYITDSWILGGAFDYSTTDADFDEDAGTTEMTAYSLAAYGKYVDGSFFWDNILSLSLNEYDNEREIGGTNTKIDSDADGMIYSLSSQVGYEFEGENTYFTPIAGMSYSHSQVDGVDESGSVFAVTTDDQDNDSLRTKLGFRTGLMSLMENEDYYILELRAFWYHELMDTDRDLGAQFNAGGTEFDVAGLEADSDSFILGLGWKYEYDTTEVKVDYDYEMSDSYNAHKLGVSWVIHF
ncbi:MAG: autotransporter domain-containing protein [Lentisphaeraceae bacterium]|nr:autotransporter domain-containing protein [Lentisphaeraceae bacterium]